jgi:hypothetical protein
MTVHRYASNWLQARPAAFCIFCLGRRGDDAAPGPTMLGFSPASMSAPNTALHQSIADSIIEHMDERGPGEILASSLDRFAQ